MRAVSENYSKQAYILKHTDSYRLRERICRSIMRKQKEFQFSHNLQVCILVKRDK